MLGVPARGLFNHPFHKGRQPETPLESVRTHGHLSTHLVQYVDAAVQAESAISCIDRPCRAWIWYAHRISTHLYEIVAWLAKIGPSSIPTGPDFSTTQPSLPVTKAYLAEEQIAFQTANLASARTSHTPSVSHPAVYMHS